MRLKTIVYSVLKLLIKDTNLSLIHNLIEKSLQVIGRDIRAHMRNFASHCYSLHCKLSASILASSKRGKFLIIFWLEALARTRICRALLYMHSKDSMNAFFLSEVFTEDQSLKLIKHDHQIKFKKDIFDVPDVRVST